MRPLTLTVEEAGRLLGVSRSTAYELVRTGELESIRLRRRVVVPVAGLAQRLHLTVPDVWLALGRHGDDADRRSTSTIESSATVGEDRGNRPTGDHNPVLLSP